VKRRDEPEASADDDFAERAHVLSADRAHVLGSDRAHLLGADRAQQLGDFIRDQRRVARLSLRKLSDMAQISNPYLSQIERGLRRPSAEILQQLAKALRISAETLYVQAGILDERSDTVDLATAIRSDATLNDSQKRALVQVLRSFQAENRVPVPAEQSA
jgi:transcriptional regulator with XRE-family HTH domain